MANLDLGTLVIKVKADGADKAKKDLNDVNNATGTAEKTSKGLGSAFKESLGGIRIFGTSLGDLTKGFGESANAGSLLGGIMGGAVVAGMQLAEQAIQKLIDMLGQLIADTYKVGVEFEAQMSRVKAIAGATGEEARQLTDIARQFGANTVFTTSEVAKGMEYMAMAGWKTEEIMSGLPGVLNLASASGEDLALVSDIVTDSLTAFGLQAKDSARMADVLAAAATNSNTNVGKMGVTFQYVAPLAGALKYSMEDVAVATGLMANAGIKGEKSGTALRSAITNMIKPTKSMAEAMDKYKISIINSDGSVKELLPTMDMLRDKLGNLDDASKAQAASAIFGKEAMSGMLAIINASEADYNKLTEAIYNSSGAAQKMSDVMNDNIAGLQKSISSKFESIKLSIFDAFSPIVEGGLKLFDQLLTYTEAFMKQIGSAINKIFGFLIPIIDVIVAIQQAVWELFYPLIEPFFEFVQRSLGDGLTRFKILGDVIMGIINSLKDSLGSLVSFLNNTMMVAVDLITLNFTDLFKHLKGMAVSFAQTFIDLFLAIPNVLINAWNAFARSMNDKLGTSFKEVETLTFDLMGKVDNAVDDGTKKVVETTDNNLNEILDVVVDVNDKTYNNFEDMYKDVMDLSDEYYGDLKSKAENYNNQYKTIDDALTQYVRDGVKEKEKEWDKLNEKNANKNSKEMYLAKAKYLAGEERKLNAEVAADREQNNREHLSMLEHSWKEQNKIIETNIKARESKYTNDVNAFKKAEQDKTKIFKEEESKRSKLGTEKGRTLYSRWLGDSVPKHATGTLYSKGGLALVGEHGAELVRLASGDRVYTNTETNNIFNTSNTGAVESLLTGIANRLAKLEQMQEQKRFTDLAYANL